MSTLTPSRNPFRSNPPTPNVTGTSMSPETTERPSSLTMTMPDNRAAQSPPPSFSAPVSPPPSVVLSPVPADETRRIPPDRDLDGSDLDGIPLEEPPPYTPRPAANSGETTVEHGPRRAFQPPPSAPTPQTNWSPQNHVMHTGNSSASLTSPPSSIGRSGSLFQQLTSSFNQVIQNLNNPYPGQQQGFSQSQPYHPPPPHPPPPSGRPSMNGSTSSRFEPPPRHPQSLSSSAPPGAAHRARSPSENMRRHSSEFARDFYAAGAGDVPQRNYDPPTGPPPPPPRPTATDNRRGSLSNDGRPTTTPHLGHPLLKDGKLLVFPKGYECEKCRNVGYKDADPLRPCKRCWSKYAKPFSGPLAYSFNNPSSSSSAQPDANFQRPLPHAPPPAPPPAPPAFTAPPPTPHFGQGGYMSNHHGGFYTPPTGIRPGGPPPPGAVVYTAGDPRIGGRLCWRCDGKGNTSFMVFDRATCAVCGGVGRTFV